MAASARLSDGAQIVRLRGWVEGASDSGEQCGRQKSVANSPPLWVWKECVLEARANSNYRSQRSLRASSRPDFRGARLGPRLKKCLRHSWCERLRVCFAQFHAQLNNLCPLNRRTRERGPESNVFTRASIEGSSA